jgi:hypothetical protein
VSTPEDQLPDPDAQPQSALASLIAPPVSPEGREWGTNYLKAHPDGVDTRGEAALLQDFAANADEARQALRQAREKLAAQRLDPSVLGMRVAQAMLAPSRVGGMGSQLSNAAGAVADWRQQNQQFQDQQATQDLGLAQQLSGVDKQSLQARLALQELQERNQATSLNTALRATANPPKPATPPPAHPHYELQEHDVTMPDGTPGKQMFQLETTTGKVIPYGDPTATGKGAGSGLDSRSGALFQRVLSSANEATSAIDNITNLPVGASSGWLGVGASPGTSWTSSAKGVLTNKLSPQTVQSYMTMLPGLAKNLAMVESGGLQTAQSLNDVFSKLELREGDTGYTQLHKLAEYRQIVEKGIEPYLSNPKIPQEQKDKIQDMIDGLRTSIPFTHNDVTRLEQIHQKNPETTFGQYIAAQGLSGGKPAGGAASALPPAALKQLQEGFTTTFSNGQKWTLHNGQPTQVQ